MCLDFEDLCLLLNSLLFCFLFVESHSFCVIDFICLKLLLGSFHSMFIMSLLCMH